MCLADHGDHIHIRLNLDDDDDLGWSQIPVTRSQFEQLLPRGTRLHVHEQEPKSKGCSEKVIDSIKTVVWPGQPPAGHADGDDVCAVCYDSFHSGDNVAVLPCSHLYHMDCVRPWFQKASTCPACRLEITAEALAAQSSVVASSSGQASSHDGFDGISSTALTDDNEVTAGDSTEAGLVVTPDERIRTHPFPSELLARSGVPAASERPSRSRWRSNLLRRPAAANN